MGGASCWRDVPRDRGGGMELRLGARSATQLGNTAHPGRSGAVAGHGLGWMERLPCVQGPLHEHQLTRVPGCRTCEDPVAVKMCPAKIPMDELKEAFHRDVIRFGHVPTRTEQNKHGTYTGTTYRNRFGSWNNALEQLGYPIRKHHGLIEVDCFHCGKTVEKEHWELEKYNKTFCSQDCLYKARVTEECDCCGGEYSQSYLNAGKQNGYCSDECAEKARLALFKCDH